MDFALTESQRSVQALAKDFATQQMAPHAASWDEQHIFPVDTLRQAAALGFAAMYCSEASHGANLSRSDTALVLEQLATACPSTAAFLSIHNMVAGIIDQYASDELKNTWSARLASMDSIGSYCLTEPSAGSDAAALQTTAKRKQDHYLLNGSKAFISGGSVSDVYICMARTGNTGADGISCLLVEKDTPGLTFGKLEKKLGWHSQPTSMLFFENCKVPTSQLIGAEGQGFQIAMQALNGGRINIAACSLGGAAACLQHAVRYVQEREQFEKPLATLQSVQFKLADMYQQLEAARLLVYRAGQSLDQNHPDKIAHCAMAKCQATDIGFAICDQALQLFGGYGYLQEYPIERFFRDLRVHQILEGTNEIMRVLLSRHVLSDHFTAI